MNLVKAMEWHQKTLVLIGMMGVGKSTIGRLLAEALGVQFLDSDREIEQRTRKTISKIFEDDGESAFRKLEVETLLSLLGKAPCVIAAGGGAFLNVRTRKHIQEQALSVWLDGPMDVMFERARKDGKRPLLHKENAREVFEALYRERKESYALADIHIENGIHPGQKTVEEILAALEQAT